jgi:ABC-type nitrate/sulfonate/bicarbonate transport system substrate-binding protein
MPALHLPWRRLICAVALAVALPGSTFAQSGPLIRVGAGPDDTSMPVIYAAQSGLFAKAGLNVELQKLAGAAVVGAALAGGSLEIGKASALSVITAHVKGLPFTVLGNIATYNSDNPDFALIVLNSSPVKTAQDLPGKILAAVSLQDMSTVATLAWLAQNGVDSTSLKFVEMPAAVTLAAMEQGRVVGSTIYEPMLSAAVSTGKVRIVGYPYDALGKRVAAGLLIANAGWVADHRDLVDRFLRVMQVASAYVGAHESEMGPMMAAYSGVDPTSITKAHHEIRGVAITPADLQPVIDAAAKYKVIPQPFPATELICGCALRR